MVEVTTIAIKGTMCDGDDNHGIDGIVQLLIVVIVIAIIVVEMP